MAVRFTYHGSPFAQQIQQQGFKSGTPSGSLRIGNRAITLADLFQKGPKTFTSTSPKVASMYGSNIPVASSTRNLSLPSGGITGSGVRFGTEVVQTPGQATKGMNVANKALDRAARGVSPTATRLAGGATVSGLGAPGGASLLSRLTGGPFGIASMLGTGIGYGADQIARATNTPEEYEAMKQAARDQGGFGYFDDVDISQDAVSPTTTTQNEPMDIEGFLGTSTPQDLGFIGNAPSIKEAVGITDRNRGLSYFDPVTRTEVAAPNAQGRPSMADIAGDINLNMTDLGNPTGDPRIASEEQGLSGFPGLGQVDPGFQNVLDAREARRNEIAMQQNPDYGQFFDAPAVNEEKRNVLNDLLGIASLAYTGPYQGLVKGANLINSFRTGKLDRMTSAAKKGLGSLGTKMRGGYGSQAAYEQARTERQQQNRTDRMIDRISSGKRTRSNPRDAGTTKAQKDAISAAIQDAARTGQSVGDTNSGGGSSGKIVCTMMNERYGFGSFRNKIWMKFHEHHGPEYQKGYHAIFLPLVKIAKGEGKINTAVRKVLEHMGRHVTADMFKIMKGKKRDTLGRIYRAIFEPACHIIGKIKSALGRG